MRQLVVATMAAKFLIVTLDDLASERLTNSCTVSQQELARIMCTTINVIKKASSEAQRAKYVFLKSRPRRKKGQPANTYVVSRVKIWEDTGYSPLQKDKVEVHMGTSTSEKDKVEVHMGTSTSEKDKVEVHMGTSTSRPLYSHGVHGTKNHGAQNGLFDHGWRGRVTLDILAGPPAGLQALFELALTCFGHLGLCQDDRVQFWAIARSIARRHAAGSDIRNPGGVFTKAVANRDWTNASSDDEDRARAEILALDHTQCEADPPSPAEDLIATLCRDKSIPAECSPEDYE